MQNLNKWGAWLGAGAILFTLAGCADRNKNGVPDDTATSGEVSKATDNAAAATGNAADQAGAAVENAAGKAGDAVENAANKAGAAASRAGEAVSGALAPAVVTPKVKTALGAQKALNGSKIDVDTNGDTSTITLKGSVKNAAQKKLAESVAKQNANGYKIVNQLQQG